MYEEQEAKIVHGKLDKEKVAEVEITEMGIRGYGGKLGEKRCTRDIS